MLSACYVFYRAMADCLKKDMKTAVISIAVFFTKRDKFAIVNIRVKSDLLINMIVKIENGINKNPTIETLTKIAKAFEVGVDDLIK